MSYQMTRMTGELNSVWNMLDILVPPYKGDGTDIYHDYSDNMNHVDNLYNFFQKDIVHEYIKLRKTMTPLYQKDYDYVRDTINRTEKRFELTKNLIKSIIHMNNMMLDQEKIIDKAIMQYVTTNISKLYVNRSEIHEKF